MSSDADANADKRAYMFSTSHRYNTLRFIVLMKQRNGTQQRQKVCLRINSVITLNICPIKIGSILMITNENANFRIHNVNLV